MKTLPQLYHEKMGIWRGLPESRYKLYNSLQRKNLNLKDLNSIEKVFKYIIESTKELEKWNKNLILKYFANNGIEHVSIYAKLSILQHFRCETPLIDWTRNPNVALYFATLPQDRSQQEDQIDNYFSIYFILKEHPYYNLTSKTGIEFLTSKNLKGVLKRLKVFRKICFSKNEINSYFNCDKNILDDIKRFLIQRIDDWDSKFVNQHTLSNYNIVAQEGLFILNADPFKPLEEAILSRIHEQSKIQHPINITFKHSMIGNKKHFICFDIHKKFIPKIIDALNSEKINITKKTMEPDFNKLAEEFSYEKITKNIRPTLKKL
jgi:hypothetical protein